VRTGQAGVVIDLRREPGRRPSAEPRRQRLRPPGARRAVLAILALAAGCAAGCAPAALPAAPGPPAGPPAVAAPARIMSTLDASPRVRDLLIDSPAVGPRVPVRLLLPTRFRAEPQRRWPVLYLLHGCCDGFRAWTRSTDVEALTAPSDVLVVMPDGGAAGFYSDWRRGSPRWETFHLVELWELLRQDYRADDRRAVAGLSMGGLGALGYTARHPGMFTAAASFSGIVHTRLDGETPRGYLDLVRGQGEDPLALWGDPAADREIWAAHNPFDLAAALAGTRLYLSAGDGRPGPLDRPGTPADDTEAALGRENAALAAELGRRGIPAEVNLYGPGTHSWPYWQRELRRAWPLLEGSLRPA
jgi:diacylglycerol O-acyltransferase / trehalose O-mycolyltransferase